MSTPASVTGPVQVVGEVLTVKKAGAYHHLTMVAPGVPERFRPGTFVTVGVGGPLSATALRRALPVHRVRPTGAYGGTVECVFAVVDAGTSWLAGAAPGTPLDMGGATPHVWQKRKSKSLGRPQWVHRRDEANTRGTPRNCHCAVGF